MIGGMGTHIQAFLELFFSHTGRLHIGFSYIILLYRVFLMFELHRVFLVSRATLEKHSRGVHPTSSDTPRCP